MPDSTTPSWWSWQKVVILTVAIAMGAFVTGVFWQFETVGEIGLHTTLRNVVNRADAENLRTADGQAGSEMPEILKEATYEQVGDQRIETYPQRLDAIARLDQVNYVERDQLRDKGPTNYV